MSYRKLFYVCNLLLLVCFVWALLVDNDAEWKVYQKTYYRMTAASMDAAAAQEKDPVKAAKMRKDAAKVRNTPLEIKQIIAGDLGRYDRCITCHVGMDEYTNPSMKTPFKSNPYKGHPQVGMPLVKNHPFTKFGCTVCHQGQGLATTKDKAHGWVLAWEKPMLQGSQIQASCVKCHDNFETLKGSEVAAKGRKLFLQHGCQGCHSINGVGQVVSVDLGDIADKPLERIAGYNYNRVLVDGKRLPETSWNIQNWILGHLVNDPAHVTPNDPFAKLNAEPIPPSGMPDFRSEISREDADAIVAYLAGMTKEEQIPYRYHVYAPPAKEPHFADAKEHGHYVFQKYGCAGCHGMDASGGRRRFNALGKGQEAYDPKMPEAEQMTQMELGREPTLPDLMGTYSHAELVAKISGGVSAKDAKKWWEGGPTPMVYMPAWKDKISKPELDDLATWLLSKAKKDESGF